MKNFRSVYVLFCILILFVACTTTKQVTKSEESTQSITPLPPDYPADMAASYYYFQGVRMSGIYRNSDLAFMSFQKALEHDSLHAPSYYELANLLLPVSSDRAQKYSYIANELDTSNIWYKEQLGRLFILNHHYDSALTVYNDIVRLAPNNPDNYKYLAALYEQTKRPYAAITLLDSAETRFGILEDLASYKRQLLIDAGLIDRAISETQTLTHNFPYDERNFIILGELYSRSNKDSLAIDAFNQALAIDPNSVDALVSLNDYYRSKNDAVNFLATTKQLFESDGIALDTKMKFFNDVIKNAQFYQQHYFAVNELVATLAVKYAGNFEVAEMYAEHQINSGDVEGALKTYKNALSDTAGIELYNTIIDIEAYLQNTDSMMHYSNLALERFPKNPDLYLKRGYGLFYLKDYQGAIGSMKDALKNTHTDSLKSVIYSSIGDMYHSMDSTDSKSYYKYYRLALKHDPDNIHALNNYSYYLSLEEKQLDKALEMIERVIEIAPSDPTYIDTYGWVLYKMGRYEDAKKAMRQAVSLDAGASKELMIHYGDVLYALKEYFMASVYWKKALEKGYDAEEIDKRMKLIEGK